MRTFATAALCAALSLTASAQTTTTTPHRSSAATATARRRAAAKAATNTAAPVSPSSSEGLAAIGTMPAVTGTAKPLYTLRYVDLKLGTGELAQVHKFYTVHYTGWTLDGKKFDSSYDHDGGQPFVFPAGARRVIIGWDTGFEGMRVGGKRRLIVPYQLAYGEQGRPPVIPEKADLIFDLELLAQSETPPGQPAAAPPPAAAAPAGAQPETKPTPQPGTNPVTDPKDQTNAPSTAKPQQ